MAHIVTAEWKLGGLFNGETIGLSGRGSVDVASGDVQLHLTSAAPLPSGFRVLPAQMICNIVLSGFAAPGGLRDVSPTSVLVRPTRIGRVFDAEDRELMNVSAVTEITVRGDLWVVDNFIDGWGNLPEIDAVLDASEHLIPNGADRATGLAHFSLLAGTQRLRGQTVCPLVLDGTARLAAPLLRQVAVTADAVTPTSWIVHMQSAWVPLNLGAPALS